MRRAKLAVFLPAVALLAGVAPAVIQAAPAAAQTTLRSPGLCRPYSTLPNAYPLLTPAVLVRQLRRPGSFGAGIPIELRG